MREYVKNQLSKCAFADLKNYDEKSGIFRIKKYSKPKYELNKGYLVKISDELVNNPTTLLAINWNNGNSPKTNYYKIFITKVMGKFIYVDALAFDYDTKTDRTDMWSGYLDIDLLTQLEQL